MPYTPFRFNSPAPAPPPQEDEGFTKTDAIAGLLRAGSGVFGASGGIPGAIAGTLGELAAEGAEYVGGKKDPFSLARIGAEGALGAIPFSRVVKPTRLLGNFLRSGTLAGAGDVMRQGANQLHESGSITPSEIDLKRSGLVALLGGGAGAAIQKGMEKVFPNYAARQAAEAAGTAAPKKAGKVLDVEAPIKTVEGRPVSTARRQPPGEGQLPLNFETGPRKFQAPISKSVSSPGVTNKPEDFVADLSAILGRKLDKIKPTHPAQIKDLDQGIEAATEIASNQRGINAASRKSHEQKVLSMAEDIVKQLDDADAATQITKARQGLTEQSPTVTETVSRTAPGGRRESLRRTFVEPDEDLSAPLNVSLEPEVSVPAAAAPAASVPAATELRKFLTFDDPLAASDLWYRTLKQEEAAGRTFPKEFQRLIGKALQREKTKANLPTNQPISATAPERFDISQPPPNVPPPANIGAELAPRVPPVADAADELNINSPFYEAAAQAEAARAGRPVGAEADNQTIANLLEFLKGEGGGGGLGKGIVGAINPELATAIAMGGFGGLGGAALGASQGVDPVLSGLAGAGLGFASPYALAKMRSMEFGAPDFSEVGDQVREAVGSKAAISDTIASTLEKIPQIQRANVLWSGPGLVANAGVGPYGSGVMGGLELALKGHGTEALQNTRNPVTFAKNWYNNLPEAERLVAQGELGRAEGLDAGVIDTAAKSYMAFPGTAMTAGDITTTNALEAAGVPHALAKEYTLTSEPWTRAGKWIANAGRGAPVNDADRAAKALINSLALFKRTPANVLEQGMERLPGIGAAVQFMKHNGDVSLQDVLAQQGLGTAVTGASYLAGNNVDPETARWMKRFVTNAGGVYSLPASIGFTVGQANARNRSGKQTIADITRDALPLPTDQSVRDIGNLFLSTVSGEAPAVPKTVMPAFVNEYLREAPQAPQPQPPRLPSGGTYTPFRFRR
jgi:hypothetical protein